MTTLHGLVDHTRQLILVGAHSCDIDHRTKHRRDREPRLPIKVAGRKCGVVDHDSPVSHREAGRRGQVDLPRLGLTDVVHRKRAFVRDDGPTLGPEHPLELLVVDLEGLVGQPEDPTAHAVPVARGDVMRLPLVRVPDLLRLRGAEVAALLHRDDMQCSHATNSTIGHKQDASGALSSIFDPSPNSKLGCRGGASPVPRAVRHRRPVRAIR